MARRGQRTQGKTAILVNDDQAKIIEGEAPVEMYGSTYVLCELPMVMQNPWLVNVAHIVRIEP